MRPRNPRTRLASPVLLLAALVVGLSAAAQPGPRDGRGPGGDRPEPPPAGGEMGSRLDGGWDDPNRGAGGDKDDHGWDRDGGPFRRLAENPELVMSVLQDLDPALAERFAASREQDPGQAFRQLRRSFPKVFWLALLKDADPEMYALRLEDVRMTRQTERLVDDYRATVQADDRRRADDLKDQLEDLVERHFDIRQQTRELELKRFEERLEKLEDAIDERRRERRELIRDRLDELTTGNDKPSW